MARALLAILFLTVLSAQEPQVQPKYQEPTEEDTAEIPRQKNYTFNPLQAQKEMTVGNFYFRQGKFHSAELRFEEATKWNPGLADAWLRLGEAAEKQNDTDVIKKAFEKYLELDPKSKNADAVRHKLATLNASTKKP